MTPSITYENIIKFLRNEIIKQSQLPSDRVLNALSIRGTNLTKVLNEIIEESYEVDDSFILFELVYVDNGNNVVIPNDEYMTSISNFNFNLHIYGNNSYMVAQKIWTGLRNENAALNLVEQGIHVNGVTFPQTINEFINNTLWIRHDLTIKFEVKFDIPNVTKTEYAKIPNKIISELK